MQLGGPQKALLGRMGALGALSQARGGHSSLVCALCWGCLQALRHLECLKSAPPAPPRAFLLPAVLLHGWGVRPAPTYLAPAVSGCAARGGGGFAPSEDSEDSEPVFQADVIRKKWGRRKAGRQARDQPPRESLRGSTSLTRLRQPRLMLLPALTRCHPHVGSACGHTGLAPGGAALWVSAALVPPAPCFWHRVPCRGATRLPAL